MSTNLKKVLISAFIILSPTIIGMNICNAAVFLDGSASGCSNGSSNYNPSTRSCGSGADTVSLDLADFSTRLAAGKTNFMRAGSYYRTTNQWHLGALHVPASKGGSSGSPTIIKAYPGEERMVIIGTAPNKMQLNPNQGDTSGANSYNYYPNPAVFVDASYTTLDGIKTYGQMIVNSQSLNYNTTIQNCDIGGGGPYSVWGQVLFIANTRNLLVKNNYIHHAVYTPEANTHKATVNLYTSTDFVFENNTFEDGWSGVDLAIGDTARTNGGTGTIRYNLFMPSPNSSGGVQGIAQYPSIGQILIYQNVFLSRIGVTWSYQGQNPTKVYNNTFVNSSYGIWDWLGLGEERIIYNNIFYNTKNNYIHLEGESCSSLINSNYNIYYNTSGSPSMNCSYSNKSFSQWAAAINGESHSLFNTNPNFVNPSGTNVQNYKRISYSENFTSSPYGTRAGAFITGSESIGFNMEGTTTTLPTANLAPPKNLSIISSTP